MGARRLERVPRRGEFAAIPRERSVEPIRPRVYSAPPSESNQSPVDTTRYRVSHRQLVIEIEIVTDESRADRDNIQLYNATTVLQDTVTRRGVAVRQRKDRAAIPVLMANTNGY